MEDQVWMPRFNYDRLDRCRKHVANRKTATETESSALQKAEDIIEWIEGNGVSEKWKIPLEIFYKVFRRKFISKKRLR